MDEIYPGLRERVSAERCSRAEGIINRFFTETLSTTEAGLPFIVTGDIPAMWLRDSTWQVAPFLRSKNQALGELLCKLSISQVRLFLIDPLANAFNPEPNGACWHRDFPDQSPWVFERKFELDSWASILYLARRVKEVWGITDHLNAEFDEALKLMIELAVQEQRHDPSTYRFVRNNGVPHDALSNDGYGAPLGYTGMVFSAFRPSDDACQYGYLIPSNYFLLSEFKKLPPHLQPTKLIEEIDSGLKDYGLSEDGYAYEIDGLGNRLMIDDANLPSLLSLPYFGAIEINDTHYQRTRDRILSDQNPYFFAGTYASGIGSQHTPDGHIWPIAIATAGLTSGSKSEQEFALGVLEATDAGTGLMHESFDKDDPKTFTRSWFSWADAMYLELLLTVYGY